METSTLLISIAIIWGIAVVTSGPNFLLVVQTAIGSSRHVTLYSVLGVCSGTIMWICSGFLGIAALFRLAPWTYLFLKLSGGGYLIFLGIQRLRSSSRQHAHAPLCFSEGVSPVQHYRQGVFTSLSNPKTAIFVSSVFAATMPADVPFSLGLTSVILMLLISFLWYTIVAYLFSLRQLRALYQRISHWIERFAGILFIGFGVKLASSK